MWGQNPVFGIFGTVSYNFTMSFEGINLKVTKTMSITDDCLLSLPNWIGDRTNNKREPLLLKHVDAEAD